MPSIRTYADALLSPRETLSKWAPGFTTAAKLALFAGLLVAAGFLLTGFAVDAAYDRPVTVENPDHISGAQCEQPTTWPDSFPEWTPPDGCSAPETLSVELGSRAGGAMAALAPVGFVGVLFAWPALGGLLHYLAGKGPRFDETFHLAALGLLPMSLKFLLLPVAVLLAPPELGTPATFEAIDSTVRAALLGWEYLPAAALSAVGLVWAGYVLAEGFAVRFDYSRTRAAAGVLASLAVIGGAGALQASVVPLDVVPAFAFVALVVAFGVVAPEIQILLDTRIDLIGMRNTEGIEPKAWYVEVVRGMSLLVLLGVVAWSGLLGVVV